VIFENIAEAQKKYAGCKDTLQISIDTKAKVSEGDYSRKGKCRTDSSGDLPKALDHDEPSKRKWTPFGILNLVSGALMILFNSSAETSDFWVDCLERWWESVKGSYPSIRCLVIYLENRPKSSGRRTQWLKRMVEFADQTGLKIRLLYYPPYHSKYNPIERCGGTLEQKWNGTLLNSIEVILQQSQRMTWHGQPPSVSELKREYCHGVSLKKKEMAVYESRLQRSATLAKYDITIEPRCEANTCNG
jgi:hypothetical protein